MPKQIWRTRAYKIARQFYENEEILSGGQRSSLSLDTPIHEEAYAPIPKEILQGCDEDLGQQFLQFVKSDEFRKRVY